MIFSNPVRGQITPFPKNAPAGIFQVTQPFGAGAIAKVVGEPPLDGRPFHRGIDLGNERCGAALLAPNRATVKFAGKLGNGEIVVVLNHGDGWGSSVGHLRARAVRDGEKVKRGQKIGEVGDSGFANGCHTHFAVKSKLPARWGLLDFIPNPYGGRGDSKGRGVWEDPWPLLEQNVTVHPRDLDGIRIRTAASLLEETVYATTHPDGTIHRAADDMSLGATATPRRWDGTVKGDAYPFDGKQHDTWERIELDGDWRYIASPLAVLSAT